MAVLLGGIGANSKINFDNCFINTRCDFKPISKDLTLKLLDAQMQNQKKKNKSEYVEIDGVKYYFDFSSVHKSSFFQSRSISYYFRVPSEKSLIRISDHWSESKYKNSKKFNCGTIASCYWTNLQGDEIPYRISGEKYQSYMMGGVAKLSSFKTIEYINGIQSYRNCLKHEFHKLKYKKAMPQKQKVAVALNVCSPKL